MGLKVYNLCCDREHLFEGWFSEVGAFERQQEQGLLTCPVCGSTAIRRTPSAPHLARSSANDEAPVSARAAPAQVQAAMLKLAREWIASTDDVGERFAQEARRIHYREVPARAIRGVASPDEALALGEEGIAVMPVPFAHLLTEPLQ